MPCRCVLPAWLHRPHMHPCMHVRTCAGSVCAAVRAPVSHLVSVSVAKGSVEGVPLSREERPDVLQAGNLELVRAPHNNLPAGQCQRQRQQQQQQQTTVTPLLMGKVSAVQNATIAHCAESRDAYRLAIAHCHTHMSVTTLTPADRVSPFVGSHPCNSCVSTSTHVCMCLLSQ